MIGNKIIHLDEVDSTNNYTAKLISAGNVTHGTVILADKQLNGRGQRGSLWSSSPNQFTCSYYLEPAFLSVEHLVFLNMGAALAVRNTIQRNLPAETVQIKWPNDVLINNKKIAGILIETQIQSNRLQSVILGVGVNLNQQIELESSCSFEQLSSIVPTNQNLAIDLANELDVVYTQLKEKKFDEIQTDYLSSLWRIQETQTVICNQTEKLIGKITGVDSTGNLLFETAKKNYSFGIKEVSFLY